MNVTKKIRVLAALGTLSGAVWAGTFATFTDSATSTSTFTAGTVDLVAGGATSDAHGFTALEMGNMKPGDVTYAPLSLANAGSLGFTYTMATQATNTDGLGLAGQLRTGVRKVALAGACSDLTYSTSADVVVAEGALSAAAIASRPLAVNAGEQLCFKVELPANTGNEFQKASTTASFTFSATQS